MFVKVSGCGLFSAHPSGQPLRTTVDTKETEFGYEDESGLPQHCFESAIEILVPFEHDTLEF